ncbi:MAG: PH domain-containing protein [Corynebacterium sp.]|nr:PH domain-containing protein [Corynebacterium sp.]
MSTPQNPAESLSPSNGAAGHPTAKAVHNAKLSDEELLTYTVADPFAVTSTKSWEVEIASPFLKKLAWLCVAILIPIHIFMGVMLDTEFTGAAITAVDKFAFPGVGLILSILALLVFYRPRLRANSDGVEIRNIIGTRFYPWQVIYGLTFPEGSRMAHLELPEFEFVPVWAIQAGDKHKAIAAVKSFRELEARYMPVD